VKYLLLKERTESHELLTLRYLNTRMALTEKEKFYYLNLEKGFEGEKQFDQLAECLQEERYILNDLLLEVNNSYFQIDTTIISQEAIYLLDIKNFEGDYYLKADKFYSVKSGRECKNPIDQLKRSGTLFRQLLQKLKLNYLVDAKVIFINPEFTLYQTPLDLPIIFPTQVHRFLRELNKIPSKLNDGHKKLAQSLLSLHQTKNPFTVLPTFHYDKVRKGLICVICNSFSVFVQRKKCICKDCGHEELVAAAVIRSASEFKHLFPTQKITTNGIYEWCQIVESKKRISYILGKNYKIVGSHQWSFYE
jgi:hypothetical protein